MESNPPRNLCFQKYPFNTYNLNSKKFKTLTSSYSTTEKHEDMLQEMIEESGKTKSGFIRYMIETFYEMSRK